MEIGTAEEVAQARDILRATQSEKLDAHSSEALQKLGAV